MSNQKGFSKIAIIIIILILIGGAYFVFSKDGNSLTDDWKTYTHEKTDDYSFPKNFL